MIWLTLNLNYLGSKGTIKADVNGAQEMSIAGQKHSGLDCGFRSNKHMNQIIPRFHDYPALNFALFDETVPLL